MWDISFCMMQTQHIINYESESRSGNTSKNSLNDIHSNWHDSNKNKASMATKKDYNAAKF